MAAARFHRLRHFRAPRRGAPELEHRVTRACGPVDQRPDHSRRSAGRPGSASRHPVHHDGQRPLSRQSRGPGRSARRWLTPDSSAAAVLVHGVLAGCVGYGGAAVVVGVFNEAVGMLMCGGGSGRITCSGGPRAIEAGGGSRSSARWSPKRSGSARGRAGHGRRATAGLILWKQDPRAGGPWRESPRASDRRFAGSARVRFMGQFHRHSERIPRTRILFAAAAVARLGGRKASLPAEACEGGPLPRVVRWPRRRFRRIARAVGSRRVRDGHSARSPFASRSANGRGNAVGGAVSGWAAAPPRSSHTRGGSRATWEPRSF